MIFLNVSQDSYRSCFADFPVETTFPGLRKGPSHVGHLLRLGSFPPSLTRPLKRSSQLFPPKEKKTRKGRKTKTHLKKNEKKLKNIKKNLSQSQLPRLKGLWCAQTLSGHFCQGVEERLQLLPLRCKAGDEAIGGFFSEFLHGCFTVLP